MTLTKSEFLLFLKHPAWLWLKKYDKQKLPPIDDSQQAVFDIGNKLEKYAEALFGGALRIGFNKYNEYQTLSERTLTAIADGTKILFQARFDTENLTCLTDVVEFTSPTSIKLYEIKSSTKVKPEHELDLAFQAHVLRSCGYDVESISVIHVNNSYIRNGEIDPGQLFKIVDITASVEEKIAETKTNIEKALQVISSTVMPDISPRHCGLNCMSDWLVIYRGLVEVPTYSIYDLQCPSPKLIGELEDSGISLIADIPDSVTLTEKQGRQASVIKSDTHFIDKESIGKFLEKLVYPIYFFDYETCSDVIPPYDGVKPYQQVPCQYSLHILDEPGSDIRHTEFIHRGSDNPIPALTRSLMNDIGEIGTVIVWYATFEKGRNSEMAQMMPEYYDFYTNLNDRVVDLMVPFSEGMYVHPAFLGSASIKKVLPVLVPELSYKELIIQEGQTAQRLWMQAMLEGKGTDTENEKLFTDLLAYCELDTLAMVRIYEKLCTLLD